MATRFARGPVTTISIVARGNINCLHQNRTTRLAYGREATCVKCGRKTITRVSRPR